MFLFKQKTAYEMLISDWSSDVCSSDLMRTHRPSTGTGVALPKILLTSACPFHSSLDWPLSSCASIHGIRPPASGAPKNSDGTSSRIVAATLRSMSRIAEAGVASPAATAACTTPKPFSSTRMRLATPPEAAWYAIELTQRQEEHTSEIQSL